MRYQVAPTVVGNDEYRVVHLISTATGVEDCLTPHPPSGQGWRLVTVAIVGTQFFQYWRRSIRTTAARAVHYCIDGGDKKNAACRIFRGAASDNLKLTRERRKVTCKACRRSRDFREGKRGAK